MSLKSSLSVTYDPHGKLLLKTLIWGRYQQIRLIVVVRILELLHNLEQFHILLLEIMLLADQGCMVWKLMKQYYDRNRENFLMHYHKRSNAESVFNMMKRKFGTHLYSKSEVGQINEVLCKALTHNICVLIQEYFENDIKRDFNYCAKQVMRR